MSDSFSSGVVHEARRVQDSTDEQAVIDQALELLRTEWLRVASRLSADCIVPLDRTQLRNGPLGRDLRRLTAVSRGDEAAEPAAVRQAIRSVLQLLFWPSGARTYAVPRGFWQTEIGAILLRADARSRGSTIVPIFCEPEVKPGADRLATYRHDSDGAGRHGGHDRFSLPEEVVRSLSSASRASATVTDHVPVPERGSARSRRSA